MIPASRAARSATTVRVDRSSGSRYACWSWRVCTVHSTSARPPGPSLVWRSGSAPRGSRSASTRALSLRISARLGVGQPTLRPAALVDLGHQARADLPVAADGVSAHERLQSQVDDQRW